jgi:oligoribonuclease
MKKLHNYLHYRSVDVTSVKELVRRWYPDGPKLPKKSDNHMALTDIRESLKELIFYRKEYFVPSGLATTPKILSSQEKVS